MKKDLQIEIHVWDFELTREQWKYLNFSDNYMISNLGRIKSITHTIVSNRGYSYKLKGKILKDRITPNGYNQCCLRINKKYKYYYIHRLVAEHFIKKINNNMEVNHKDGNKLNNNIKNLEILTSKENKYHAKINKLVASSENHGLTYLTNKDILKIRQLANSGFSNSEIAKKYKLTTKYIWAIVTRRTWKYI